MFGDNGHERFLENAGHSFSLRDLLEPLTSPNGVAETPTDSSQPRTSQIRPRVLVILLPLYYNPDENGKRIRVERCRFTQTFAEIRQYCSGFTLYKGEGWCHSLRFRGDFDEHIKIEIESCFTNEDIAFLKTWKRDLEIRFQQ